jgi:hypothetical protein
MCDGYGVLQECLMGPAIHALLGIGRLNEYTLHGAAF